MQTSTKLVPKGHKNKYLLSL